MGGARVTQRMTLHREITTFSPSREHAATAAVSVNSRRAASKNNVNGNGGGGGSHYSDDDENFFGKRENFREK